MGRGRADDWQSGTRLSLCGGCKAQREVLVSSGRIEVHATITKHARCVRAPRGENHQCTPLQSEALGRGRADDCQSGTRLSLCGGCKAQREVLVSSGRMGVHATITQYARESRFSSESRAAAFCNDSFPPYSPPPHASSIEPLRATLSHDLGPLLFLYFAPSFVRPRGVRHARIR